MRTIQGTIVLPPDAPDQKYDRLTVEIRDVSIADAPSVVIAEETLQDVAIEPNGIVPFRIEAPDVGAERALSLRVHASRDGSARVKSGDLLTTMSYPIPPSESYGPMTVRMKVI